MPPAPRPDRRQLWTSALAFWRTRPWLGVGPDSFRHLHPGTIAGVAPDNRTHANSLYLEALVNTGLLGLAALLGLMTATALLARRAWRQATSIDDRMLLAGVVAGVAAFFLHGLVDYFWSFAPTAGLFWLLLGALGGLVTRRQPASS